MTSMSWLLVVFGAQVVLFLTFIVCFFTMEQRRQGELESMQTELHRLRAENLRSSKKLLHANRRMLKYEVEIKSELNGGGDGEDAEEDELEDEEDAGAADAADEADAEAEAGRMAHDSADPVAHGSIAPAAHIEPRTAPKRVRGASDGDGSHAHPLQDAAPATSVLAIPAALRGKCVEMAQEWWTYEVCFGVSVKQFHDAPAKDGDEPNMHSLGSFVPSTSVGSLWLQRYKNGDACTGGTRSSEVKLSCPTNPTVSKITLQDVHEPHTCHYLLSVDLPVALCRRAGLLASTAGEGGSEATAAATAAAAAATTATEASAGGTAHADGSAAGLLRTAETAVRRATSIEGGDDYTLGERYDLAALQALPVDGGHAIRAKRQAVVNALRHSWQGCAVAGARGQREVEWVEAGRKGARRRRH